MGYVELIPITPDQLDTCDSCDNQGVRSSGRSITNSYDEEIMWFCYTCVQRSILGIA
jgi:hypothetical protein